MFEQFGPLYYQASADVQKPTNSNYLRLFRKLSDGLYYVKFSNGTEELFTVGTNIPLSLFQKVASVNNLGAGEDDLYTDAIAANTLSHNGASIQAKYTVRLANTANAKTVRLYFAGSKIFESVHDYSGGTLFYLDINVHIIRVDANTFRSEVSYVTNGVTESLYTAVTPVDFTIANDLKITGEGVADSDITALFAKGIYYPQV